MERLQSCMAALQDEDVRKRAVQDAKEYAISHGLCMKSKSQEPDSYTFVPFCLLPSPYPREAFQQVKALQEDINLLIHRVAHDYSFLRDCLQSTIETDEFTASIFNIYQKPISLGLLRSDYMLDLKSGDTKELHEARPKQVEVNTIASSFGGITPPLYKLQKYTMSNLGVVATEVEVSICDIGNHRLMPKCKTDKLLGKGLLAGWRAYKNDKVLGGIGCCIGVAAATSARPGGPRSSTSAYVILIFCCSGGPGWALLEGSQTTCLTSSRIISARRRKHWSVLVKTLLLQLFSHNRLHKLA
ncbi:hypothetical protein HPB51_004162 [Rhipicephalus microplus]|uniref:Glutathione synthetase n=1 Tax=Rhipicephalus microplus TaxID=6941 RepID=A0A9J6D3W0_RHIMP|nr:hypothetical protein HPB51_004162 [Rhipicephalus microplus]